MQAYLAAWVDVVSSALAVPDETIDTLMPHDFVHADVLKLKTAHSKEDFAAALMRESRLGRLLARASMGQQGAALPDEPDSSL
ncbi:MAG TPA: hypothetical protein VGO62_20380 [Myxococcota bacterium]